MRPLLLVFSVLFSSMLIAQDLQRFEDMNRSEIRSFLLSQERSEKARIYAEKHQKTRKVAHAFLIGSGAVALGGVVFHYTNSYSEDGFEELGHAVALASFAITSGVALATSGILYLISNGQLQKAKDFYLTSSNVANSASLELGYVIRF